MAVGRNFLQAETSSAQFVSILFDDDAGQARRPSLSGREPFLDDLHISRIVSDITDGRSQYDLEPLFLTPSSGTLEVEYRQQAFRDLQRGMLRSTIETFAARMVTLREHQSLAAQLKDGYQRDAVMLAAASSYVDAVAGLDGLLRNEPPASPGFCSLAGHVGTITGSAAFRQLAADAQRVQSELGAIRYCLRIHGRRVHVSPYRDEPDYSQEITETFRRFRQGPAKDYRLNYRPTIDFNHVEAMVLERVAAIHPDEFADLENFCQVHTGYVDQALLRFDREVQFYLAYLAHMDHLQEAGLPFCYPEVSPSSKETWVENAYDMALAPTLIKQGRNIVPNDVMLTGTERILLVTGPNQGGKTTFARMVGQLHFFAGIGCPIPGTSARLFQTNRILTHFEHGENLSDLRGKLKDDLIKVRDILDASDSGSLVILNETFSSTGLHDALELGRKVLGSLTGKDALTVYVSFLDELAALPTAVSMESTVRPDDPATRTFKVVRKPVDGRVYAKVLAEKYGLSYTQLKEMLTP